MTEKNSAIATYDAFIKLYNYCEAEQYKGYDPYDGLNSKLLQSIPLLRNNRLVRLAWIQFFKRSPVNLRTLLGVKKEYNPKALGLFLASYCIFYKHHKSEAHLKKINWFIKLIEEQKTKGFSGDCWGYNFDWQARAFFQPRFYPTIIATCFNANALLDAYELIGDEKLLTSARSTCDFILKDLNRSTKPDGSFAVSYSPIDHSVIYNTSLMGARLLARVYAITKEEELFSEAKKLVSFCCADQKEDGSWSYGTASFHYWIDNFHTGYNLECIHDYMLHTGDNSFTQAMEKGFDYYVNTFFTEEGISKYYSNSTYPIDIHAPAQLVTTLAAMGKMDEQKELLDRVMGWTIKNMQHKKGYFIYQVNKYVTSRIPYMRWSQAWMFRALALYLGKFAPKGEQTFSFNEKSATNVTV